MRRVGLFLLLLLIFFGGLASAPASEQKIRRITVEGAPPGGPDALTELLGLKIGAPLDAGLLRSGLQAATASGLIRWIRVEKEETGEGLEIRVSMDLRPRLAKIEISAPTLKWRLKLRRWIDQSPGDPVEAAQIELMARKIERRVADAGYPEGRVNPYLSFVRATNTVKLQLVLDLGPPDTIEKLSLRGLPEGVSQEELRLKFKQGKRLRKKRKMELEEKVETRLRERGWWDAVVTGTSRESSPEGTTLLLRVDPGPHYTLHLIAPPDREAKIREALPDPKREDLNASQLENLNSRVEENLRLMGYPLAKVQARIIDSGPGERVLELRADTGPEAKISEILFPGAMALSARELKNLIPIKPGAGPKGKAITRQTLENARRSLERAYLQSGFSDVVVHPAELGLIEVPESSTPPPGARGLRLSFPIEEGVRSTILSFEIQGLPSEVMWGLDREDYRFELTEPWDPKRLDNILKLWKTALADSGYPEGEIRAEIQSPEPTKVALKLRVEPGRFIHFGRIVIAGLRQGREKLVRRILKHVGLREGDPYLESTLLRAQQELYRLGLFRSVSIGAIPGQEMMVRRGIVVELDEGEQRSYLLGLGWGSDEGGRITLGWSHLNLFGGGYTFSLETRYSSREFRYQLALGHPLLQMLQTPGYLAFYQTEEHFSDYDQKREGTWLEIGDRLKRPYRHWIRYEYQVVEPTAPQEILSGLEKEQQRIHLSSIMPIFEWDHRDDQLNPSQGFLASTSLEWAFLAFGSESEFLKLRSNFSIYHRISGGKLSAGLRLGAIFIPNAQPEIPENLQTPLAVRFFAGGATTHRAFPRDRLGIPGSTIDADGRAIGGNASVLINLEYQHQLWKSMAGVLFLDGGNVWAQPEDVTFSAFRWGLGLGLRLETPAGPFRLEYAQKLERLTGESAGEFSFSFGVAF